MNEQRFTIHINFVKGKEFVEKNEHHISSFYLDFFYLQDYYNERFILATLYTLNESLMEEFGNSINSLFSKDIYRPYIPAVYPNSLFISKITRHDLPIISD